MFGLTNQGFGLRDYEEHIARFLSDQGLETVLSGVQHVTGHSEEELKKLPYDRFLPPFGEEAQGGEDLTTEAAIRYLREPHETPFFLNVGYAFTHHGNWDRSFVMSREEMGPLDARNVRPLPHLPDTPSTRWEAAMQYRATEYLDTRIGLLLEALEETGLSENTLVVFTTDHGPGLPGVKTHLNDRGLGVVTLIRGPGEFRGGVVVEELTSHLDFFPTFCDLLGCEPPEGLSGKSMVPMVSGEWEQPVHECLFSEQTYHGRFLPLRSVRTERFRYIRRYGDPASAWLHFNADMGEAYQIIQEAGGGEVLMPEEQLFDLHLDPQEQVNVVEDHVYSDVLRILRQRLDLHLELTADPIHNGVLPALPPKPDWTQQNQESKRLRKKTWHDRRIAIQQEDHERSPQLYLHQEYVGSDF